MTTGTGADPFATARAVADAVLWEGYVLYPYRASAAKNHVRFQWGVVVPDAHAKTNEHDRSTLRSQCVLEVAAGTQLRVVVRFLQAEARVVEQAAVDGGFEPVERLDVDGSLWVTWDEAVVHEIAVGPIDVGLDDPAAMGTDIDLHGAREIEELRDAGGVLRGRVVRERWPLQGSVWVDAEPVPGPFPLVVVSARIHNTTDWHEAGARHDDVTRHSMLGAHAVLVVDRGGFMSSLDPPTFAKGAVDSCKSEGLYPVLLGPEGDRSAVLLSPIILYDHPEIAPESDGDLFDALEIDEILLLRTMTLTDDEKREARRTDPRAAAVIDRADDMPAEVLARLHGAIRSLRRVTRPSPTDAAAATPPPGNDDDPPVWGEAAEAAYADPGGCEVKVSGMVVRRGSRVRLEPGHRRADAHDLFLAGKLATVDGVYRDFDGETHVAVVLDDDPGADLHQWHGRFLYFRPDEVVPVSGASR